MSNSAPDARRRHDRGTEAVRAAARGLRLVTAFGIAAMLGTMGDVTHGLPDGASLNLLAGNFALWASVSEGRSTRGKSSRDLAVLSAAAAVGAASFSILVPLLSQLGPTGRELVLVIGAFCVGYLRRFGLTGTGIGSQIYIGQLLAFGVELKPSDLPTIAVAGLIAAIASVVPRVLSGPAEHPPPFTPLSPASPGTMPPALAMGLQAATGALLIVALNATIGLVESSWVITACTYVIAGSSSGTLARVRRRIIGTIIGVPVALGFLLSVATMPIVVWTAAGAGNGGLRNSAARSVRHCVWRLCFHPDRYARRHGRTFHPGARRTRVGDAARRRARTGRCNAAVPASAVSAGRGATRRHLVTAPARYCIIPSPAQLRWKPCPSLALSR
jgi:hypothetical protein